MGSACRRRGDRAGIGSEGEGGARGKRRQRCRPIQSSTACRNMRPGSFEAQPGYLSGSSALIITSTSQRGVDTLKPFRVTELKATGVGAVFFKIGPIVGTPSPISV